MYLFSLYYYYFCSPRRAAPYANFELSVPIDNLASLERKPPPSCLQTCFKSAHSMRDHCCLVLNSRCSSKKQTRFDSISSVYQKFDVTVQAEWIFRMVLHSFTLDMTTDRMAGVGFYVSNGNQRQRHRVSDRHPQEWQSCKSRSSDNVKSRIAKIIQVYAPHSEKRRRRIRCISRRNCRSTERSSKQSSRS